MATLRASLGMSRRGNPDTIRARAPASQWTPPATDKRGQRSIAATGCHYADAQLVPLLDTFGLLTKNFQLIEDKVFQCYQIHTVNTQEDFTG